jgi:hypothetical protein
MTWRVILPLTDIYMEILPNTKFKETIEKMNSNRDDTRANKFSLKFLLTSCLVENQFLRTLANPFFKYGTFHAALSIDNLVILESDAESIICPHVDVISLLIAVNIENKKYQSVLGSIMNIISTGIDYVCFLFRLRADPLCYREISRLSRK